MMDLIINNTSTTVIYTLSLHDALPISLYERSKNLLESSHYKSPDFASEYLKYYPNNTSAHSFLSECIKCTRSEEHTSELQSQFQLVCRLLLEKKKNDVHLEGVASENLS